MPSTIYKEKTINKLQPPKMYKVVLLNDDYTTMDFVLQILMSIFGKTEADAFKIMLKVHQTGSGIAGLYSYDIALTKVTQTENLAKEYGHPLKLTIEAE